MTTPARARIRLAAELAGWDLDRNGLTDAYRKDRRYLSITYDLHDRVRRVLRQDDTGQWLRLTGRGKADRIVRLLARPRWTTTD
jgi:hypothetical protein